MIHSGLQRQDSGVMMARHHEDDSSKIKEFYLSATSRGKRINKPSRLCSSGFTDADPHPVSIDVIQLEYSNVMEDYRTLQIVNDNFKAIQELM